MVVSRRMAQLPDAGDVNKGMKTNEPNSADKSG